MSTSPERDEEQEAVDRAGPPRLYLPEDGTGLLYGPDGKPVDGEAEEDDDDGVPDDWPHVACDYCRTEKPKRKVVRGGRFVRWRLPEGWRELPNGLTECDGCRPVKDVQTGRMVRPGPDQRGGDA